MAKVINSKKLTESLTISKCNDGFWLYDKTRGMNLSMRAKTEQDAFVSALTYYQKRCAEIEQKKKKLKDSVSGFIDSLSDNEEIYFPCDCDDHF